MNHFFTGQVFFQSWLDIKKNPENPEKQDLRIYYIS